jgi:hypothetical protein
MPGCVLVIPRILIVTMFFQFFRIITPLGDYKAKPKEKA